MAFNSLAFIYGFLPLALLVYYILARVHFPTLLVYMAGVSLAFYAIGDAKAVPILLVSLFVNFAIGQMMSRSLQKESHSTSRVLMGVGIAVNICVLAFYKYAPAFSALRLPFAVPAPFASVVLPLAISFFTFSQISYLIELHTKKIEQPSFLKYCTYVLFFPKLIAGPIARPSELLDQLNPRTLGIWDGTHFLQGISFFIIGLFKKVVIADQLARLVGPAFDAAARTPPTFYRAWHGTFAYGFQLYFDFSGYSDMAIGVALLFGIFLPLNFDSPYTATNISEFWRKWHITLSSFLREYVYFPLGGNRKGTPRKLLNLLIVMVLCGMWHGAGLTFVVWGALHGIYLIIFNLWSSLRTLLWKDGASDSLPGRLFGKGLTFFAVTVAWVFFRAENLKTSLHMLGAMFHLPSRPPTLHEAIAGALTLLPPLVIVWMLPTTQRWLRYRIVSPQSSPAITSPGTTQEAIPASGPIVDSAGEWRPNFWRGLLIGLIALAAISLLSQASEFIYGNF